MAVLSSMGADRYTSDAVRGRSAERPRSALGRIAVTAGDIRADRRRCVTEDKDAEAGEVRRAAVRLRLVVLEPGGVADDDDAIGAVDGSCRRPDLREGAGNVDAAAVIRDAVDDRTVAEPPRT
jgi:hypothetical protein